MASGQPQTVWKDGVQGVRSYGRLSGMVYWVTQFYFANNVTVAVLL